MIHNISKTRKRHSAFTLVEMTIVIMIIAIMAAPALPDFVTAQTQARVHRTRAVVARLDSIIGEKWDADRTRQVPLRIIPGSRPVGEPFTDTLANADLTNGIRD